MTYKNAVKRICAMPEAGISLSEHYSSDIRSERVSEIVSALGGIGEKCAVICVSGEYASAYAAGMLESVLHEAGHKVGRVGIGFLNDFREQIRVNCAPVERNVFAEAVKKVISVAQEKNMLCEMAPIEKLAATAFCIFTECECDTVIIGSDERTGGLISVLSAVGVPRVELNCGISEKTDNREFVFRKGTAEVVSIPQSKDVYNMLSNGCAAVGARLTVPARAELSDVNIQLTCSSFSYYGKKGYALRCATERRIMCALAVIEAAYALRRTGVIVPSVSIMSGIAKYRTPGLFDVVSVNPTVIVDCAANGREAAMLFDALSFFTENAGIGRHIVVCLPSNFSVDIPTPPAPFDIERTVWVSNPKRELPDIISSLSNDSILICFGGTQFAGKMRYETVRILNSTFL